MAQIPDRIARFLGGERLVVAGVSRHPAHVGNVIYRKLRDSGREVLAVNPNAAQVEGVKCYPDLASVPGSIDGVVVATHPRTTLQVVRQCAERGVGRIWLHRSFGQGSVSPEAVRECEARGIECIAGGCPMMYCEPVDMAHRCVRWLLGMQGRLPR